MVIGKKEFRKLAISMGVAKPRELRMFFSEFPQASYDDEEDIVKLWEYGGIRLEEGE